MPNPLIKTPIRHYQVWTLMMCVCSVPQAAELALIYIKRCCYRPSS